MNSHIDKELKAVIQFLRRLQQAGTMGADRREAIAKAVQGLRKAARSNDPEQMKKAIGKIVDLFLKL